MAPTSVQVGDTLPQPWAAAVESTWLQVQWAPHQAEVVEGPDPLTVELELAGQAHNVALEQPPLAREEKGRPLAGQRDIVAVDPLLK